MTARGAGALILLFVLAATAVAQQPQLPPRDLPRSQTAVVGNGSITGVVRAADTGLPLRGVDIRLTGTDLRANARGAYTDASGSYEFAGLPDGEYTLVASKVRYMTMTYGQTRAGEAGRPVQVTGGRRVENVDFALPAGAVIVLRVGDRFGDPAVGYPVNLYQAKSGSGQRALVRVPVSGFPAGTDDRGDVRLSGLAPGEYYLSAGGGPTLPGTATAAPEQEVQTYYPGTPADSDAQPITVGLGEEVAVSFNTVVSRTYRLSGTVIGNAPAEQVRLDRVTPTGTTILDLSIGSGRTFSRANLAPGEYVLTARNEKEIGTLHVLVGAADISDLVLTMRPATPIRGRLTFEGTPPRGVAPTAFVLRPALVNNSIAAVAQYRQGDWTFEIPPLTGSGVIRGELPRGWFLKAVLLDGRDVTDTVLDFETYEGKPVEIVLTQTATEISGRVADESGRAVTNYVAVAFPADPRRWTPLTRRIASVRPDQLGRFSIRGLPPGSYLVAAVDYLPTGQDRDPKTLERLRAGAPALTLTDAQAATVDLRLTP
jgi:hypothetical protein